MKKCKLSDYRVEHSKVFGVDCSTIEYAYLWVPDSQMIQNAPLLPDKDIDQIKEILKKHSVFDFKINLSL